MEPYDDPTRGQVLDTWDYRTPFSPFQIRWQEGDLAPAFESGHALAIALHELDLEDEMEVLAHREKLVTFSSEHVIVGRGPAEREPAWVVMIAGTRHDQEVATEGALARIQPGGGVVVQLLIHAREGEILLGVSVPVKIFLE